MNDTETKPEATANYNTLNLSDLARLIRRAWKTKEVRPNVHPTAKPYLDALDTMDKITDNYVADPGSQIVAYFLGNATSWRGPVAKAVKAELKRRLK